MHRHRLQKYADLLHSMRTYACDPKRVIRIVVPEQVIPSYWPIIRLQARTAATTHSSMPLALTTAADSQWPQIRRYLKFTNGHVSDHGPL